MPIDKSKLTKVSNVYPLKVSPYEQYMGDFSNPSVVSKINSMVQTLLQMGRLTNQTVSQWNTVMEWIVNGGMDEIATDITTTKIDVALKQVMDMLDVSLNNGLKELAENTTKFKIDELLASGQFEEIVNSALTEINRIVTAKLNDFSSQLEVANEHIKDSNEMIGYRHKINVEDVMKKNSLLTLQGVFDLIPNNTELHFSKLYNVTSEILIKKSGIKLVGDISSTLSNGGGIKNIGIGNALRIIGSKITLENLAIKGNGGQHGINSTGQNGLVLDATSNVFIDGCTIDGHGKNGIFVTNGGWVMRIKNTLIENNKEDGINSISIDGAQNGNNLIIKDCMLNYNGRHGINFRGANLLVSGNDIEQNLGAGFRVDTTGATIGCYSMEIHSNYLEQNRQGNIWFTGLATTKIQGVSIHDNYNNASYAGTGATSLMIFDGELDGYAYINFGLNTFGALGNYVTNYVNFNDVFNPTCRIVVAGDETKYLNMRNATIEKYGIKTSFVSGLFHQKGIPWAGIGKSDNIVSTVTGNFEIPLIHGSQLRRIKTLINTDSQNYNVEVYVFSKSLTTNANPISIAYMGNLNKMGDQIVNMVIANFTSNSRLLNETSYYVRFVITLTTPGTFMYINDLAIEYN